ncbi:MAG: hypothetical protein K2J20_00810, partial [Bacilli bacterium]|nr:hypothetical protein [Bacilli bacterium]
MKNKKNIIIAVIIAAVVLVVSLITYNILTDDNKLTAGENSWINKNINTIQNVNVVNDVNIFGNTGSGVFYEFINDLELEYKLQINPVTFNMEETVSGLTLGVKNSLGNNDKVFYVDHYVLVSKKDEIVASYDDFANKKIGVIKSDVAYITSYLNNISELNLTSYDKKEDLLDALSKAKDIEYMIVPLTVYLDEILTQNYYIVNHMSDVKFYYTLSGNKNDTLYRIINKFYNNWYGDNLDEYFKREEFKLFINAMQISETEVDAMQSVTYKYGFINNSPYEVIMSGNYGGIVAMYLDEFGMFSKIEFNYKKYSNLNKFKKAIKNG